MKNDDIENILKKKKKIEQVETPPFLFTRIQQKISAKHSLNFSKKVVWAYGFAFLFILTVNIFVIFTKINEKTNEVNIAQVMNLVPNNSIYNE